MFRGALTALITPFRNNEIDSEALTRLVDAQIEAGISGLVPCGTTGESCTLSHAEHIEVVRLTIEAAKGRVPVLAGAGSNCTGEAIDLARAAKDLGAAGTLQITPYYNKPTQRGLLAHVLRIAETVDLPVVVYNVPGRTSVDLLPETLAQMAEHPNVVGVKEATGDMVRAARVRELCGPDFDLLSGDDHTLLPFLATGGDGVISVGSNLVPKLFADLCATVQAGDLKTARELHYRQLPLTRALFTESSPIPVKTAMAMLGRCAFEIRLPLQMLEEGSASWNEVKAALEALELRR